jgi:hypothetical protein
VKSHRAQVKVYVLPLVTRLIARGWLAVGVFALAFSDSPDRWHWAVIGLACGSLFLPATRPIRVVVDYARGTLILYRPTFPWRTLVAEWPISHMATANVVRHEAANPYDQNWSRGRDGLVLLLRSGESVPVVERIDASLEKQRDAINSLLSAYASVGASYSPGGR